MASPVLDFTCTSSLESAVSVSVSIPGSIVSSFVSDSIDGRDAEWLYRT